VSDLILALDPSTDVTGAAILTLEGELVAYDAFDGFELAGQPPSRHKLEDRLARICETRYALSHWLVGQPACQAVAYETQSGRGHASSEALVMALGSYLTLTCLRGLPLIPVNRSAGCSVVGASKVYAEPAGTTPKERQAKRARLKAAVIAGVNARLGLSLRPDQDAEADAIAVGLASLTKFAGKTTKKASVPAQRKGN
jgi:Holliday junction resolvasome RuvABC endonuclease subunit